jgi:hypothetical protein
MKKQPLIEAVVRQIEADLKVGEQMALEELLFYVPTEYLVRYLHEDDAKEFMK